MAVTRAGGPGLRADSPLDDSAPRATISSGIESPLLISVRDVAQARAPARMDGRGEALLVLLEDGEDRVIGLQLARHGEGGRVAPRRLDGRVDVVVDEPAPAARRTRV